MHRVMCIPATVIAGVVLTAMCVSVCVCVFVCACL